MKPAIFLFVVVGILIAQTKPDPLPICEEMALGLKGAGRTQPYEDGGPRYFGTAGKDRLIMLECKPPYIRDGGFPVGLHSLRYNPCYDLEPCAAVCTGQPEPAMPFSCGIRVCT